MTTMDMIDEFIETLKPSEGSSKTFKYLSEQNVLQLCQKAKEILMNEANVQPVRAPVTIVVRPNWKCVDLRSFLIVRFCVIASRL